MVGVGFLIWGAALAALPSSERCAVDQQDYVANAKLSFDDFDQKGTLPGSMRALVNRGCWSAAVDVTQRYLIEGPPMTERQQRALRFHLAQQLANIGDNHAAALVVAGTRDPQEDLRSPDALRWNDFVIGHWAFFTDNRPLLVQAVAAVNSGSGEGNRINGILLEGLAKCFTRPYRQAVDQPCRTPSPRRPE